MALSFIIYERKLPVNARKWQQKILTTFRLDDAIKAFVFGRNDQTKNLYPEIMNYPFVSKDQARFKLLNEGKSYLLTPAGQNVIFLRKTFSFLFFKTTKEVILENEPIQVTKGDKLVIKDATKRKEIVLEISQIY